MASPIPPTPSRGPLSCSNLCMLSGRHRERHGSPAKGSGCLVSRRMSRIAPRISLTHADFAWWLTTSRLPAAHSSAIWASAARKSSATR